MGSYALQIVFPGNSTTAQNLRAAAAGGNTIVSRTIARDQYITSVVRQRTAALQKVRDTRGEAEVGARVHAAVVCT
jgi:hypothetical protein